MRVLKQHFHTFTLTVVASAGTMMWAQLGPDVTYSQWSAAQTQTDFKAARTSYCCHLWAQQNCRTSDQNQTGEALMNSDVFNPRLSWNVSLIWIWTTHLGLKFSGSSLNLYVFKEKTEQRESRCLTGEEAESVLDQWASLCRRTRGANASYWRVTRSNYSLLQTCIMFH